MTTDTIDATLAMPRFNAPLAALTAAVEDISPCALSGLDTHDCGGRVAAMSEDFTFQSPNLRTRLDLAITKARTAQSPIDRREWTEEAQSLCERLVDIEAVCPCGVAYSLTTGRCEACDEQKRLIEERRTHIGVTGRQRDADVPF